MKWMQRMHCRDELLTFEDPVSFLLWFVAMNCHRWPTETNNTDRNISPISRGAWEKHPSSLQLTREILIKETRVEYQVVITVETEQRSPHSVSLRTYSETRSTHVSSQTKQTKQFKWDETKSMRQNETERPWDRERQRPRDRQTDRQKLEQCQMTHPSRFILRVSSSAFFFVSTKMRVLWWLSARISCRRRFSLHAKHFKCKENELQKQKSFIAWSDIYKFIC